LNCRFSAVFRGLADTPPGLAAFFRTFPSKSAGNDRFRSDPYSKYHIPTTRNYFPNSKRKKARSARPTGRKEESLLLAAAMMMLVVMFMMMLLEGDHQQFLTRMKKYHFLFVTVFHDISLLRSSIHQHM